MPVCFGPARCEKLFAKSSVVAVSKTIASTPSARATSRATSSWLRPVDGCQAIAIAFKAWCGLPHQFNPFGSQRGEVQEEASYVTARSRKAGYEARLNRVGLHIDGDYRRGLCSCCGHANRVGSDDHQHTHVLFYEVAD